MIVKIQQIFTFYIKNLSLLLLNIESMMIKRYILFYALLSSSLNFAQIKYNNNTNNDCYITASTFNDKTFSIDMSSMNYDSFNKSYASFQNSTDCILLVNHIDGIKEDSCFYIDLNKKQSMFFNANRTNTITNDETNNLKSKIIELEKLQYMEYCKDGFHSKSSWMLIKQNGEIKCEYYVHGSLIFSDSTNNQNFNTVKAIFELVYRLSYK
jgi:hypothetical protein